MDTNRESAGLKKCERCGTEMKAPKLRTPPAMGNVRDPVEGMWRCPNPECTKNTGEPEDDPEAWRRGK